MHLVVYFCGTGDSGFNFSNEHAEYAHELKANNTQTLIVHGCQHEEVCNNGLTPDLEGFANRFMNKVFTKNKNGDVILSRPSSAELAQLGVGIQPGDARWVADYRAQTYVQVPLNQQRKSYQQYVGTVRNGFEDQHEPIESITFVGYSRGAVTCFTAAKVKEQMGIDVPLRIVANQPVPGSLYALPGTNAATVADCSKLKHVEAVDLTIAAYTGATSTLGLVGKLQKMFHRLFFSQIIPKLPTENCTTNLEVIPRDNHWEGGLTGAQHLQMNLTKQLAKAGLLAPSIAEDKKAVVTDYYRRNRPVFPDAAQVQRAFGANIAHMYDHVDPHYIEKLKPQEYQEFLYKWWQAQETQASRFSTKLTKDLLSTMRDRNYVSANEKLIDIFTEADAWLLAKEGTGSSRYAQVMKLRESVRERLLHKCDNVSEMEDRLDNINRNLIQTTHYFEKQWQRESKATSWFKTDATRELDKAFKEHAQAEKPSLENDEQLLAAMDKWLESKEPTGEAFKSSSSRYELVGRMRVQLKEEMERYPTEDYATRASM